MIHIPFVRIFVNIQITTKVIFNFLRFNFNFKNQNLIVSNIENWEQDITNEIIELHEFFQNWFNGTIPQSEFSRFAGVMDKDFKIISPPGDLTERSKLVSGLEKSYGNNSTIQISVRNISVESICDNIYIAIYEEIQEYGLEITARISTAIFRRNEKMVNNHEWLHVHETWM